ncbi:MAG TPA: metalloregulator ArsR/SmtB family transcription factor [Devosia sp.]
MPPVDQFSALADQTRCRVIELLHQRPMPVHELTAAFDISRPAISRHLRVLKEARLVKEEKKGRENVYALQRPRLKPMLQWLERHESKAEVVMAKKVKVKAVAPVLVAAPVRKVAEQRVVPVKPVAPQLQLDLF